MRFYAVHLWSPLAFSETIQARDAAWSRLSPAERAARLAADEKAAHAENIKCEERNEGF